MKKEITVKQLIERIKKEGPGVIQDLPLKTKKIVIKNPLLYPYPNTELDVLIQDLSFIDPKAIPYRTKVNGERFLIM